jgi:hypothetical protein
MTVSKSVLRDIGAAVQARQPKPSGDVQIMV